MRSPGLLIHPRLDETVFSEVRSLAVAKAYAEAEPLPGGRGTVRQITLGQRPFLLKREARGGAAARALPDRYLVRGPFLREWALSLWLETHGLCPPMAARWLVPRGALLAVYTLLEPVADAPSLADLLREGKVEAATCRDVGQTVGRLHRAGVLHGDLNAGNLLLAAGGALVIDLRHSFRMDPLPADRRRGNLDRLARSVVKLAGGGFPSGGSHWEELAKGYIDGFGSAEAWPSAWWRSAGRVGLLRRLGWKVRGL